MIERIEGLGFYLVAEDPKEMVLVEALRKCGVHAVRIHSLFMEEEHLAKKGVDPSKTVEFEFLVPCTCGAVDRMLPSYDPATGHYKDCPVPVARKAGIPTR